jgi:hypothetical protein
MSRSQSCETSPGSRSRQLWTRGQLPDKVTLIPGCDLVTMPAAPKPHQEDSGHADTPFKGVDAARAPRRVPHARVSKGQLRSLTDTSPPMTWTSVRAGQQPGRGTDLPSWSCGFDSRHPLFFPSSSCRFFETCPGSVPAPPGEDQLVSQPSLSLVIGSG